MELKSVIILDGHLQRTNEFHVAVTTCLQNTEASANQDDQLRSVFSFTPINRAPKCFRFDYDLAPANQTTKRAGNNEGPTIK